MAELNRDGVVLAYDDTGAARLPPLVLIHGLSSSRATWSRLLPELTDRFRVLRFDQRGHGESSHAPGTYTLAHYVPDAVAFCERVVGEPAVVAGHSLGGVVAAVLGRERPDLARGVFLEDPPLYRAGDDEPSETGVARMFPVMRQVLTDMQGRKASVDEYDKMIGSAPAMNGKGTFRDVSGDDSVRAQARAFATMDPEVFTPAIDRTALAEADPSKPISCPVAVVRADPALSAAFTQQDETRFLETNPNASVELITGASHAVHDDEPKRFLAALFAFVERLSG